MTGQKEPDAQPLVDVRELFLLLRRAVPDSRVVQHDRAFIQNIAYTLQYMDHLVGTLNGDTLRTTIHSQTCKAIVMAGMGVVEALLWYVVKAAGQANTSSWREVSKQLVNDVNCFGTNVRVITILLEGVSPPISVEMTLDTLIKKVESRKLLGISDHKVYGTLKSLRQLRNRIHIHDIEALNDTDWYKFTGREVVMLLKSLNAIFATSLFNPEPHHHELLLFLSPDRVEVRR